jgi:hypothetical protein
MPEGNFEEKTKLRKQAQVAISFPTLHISNTFGKKNVI